MRRFLAIISFVGIHFLGISELRAQEYNYDENGNQILGKEPEIVNVNTNYFIGFSFSSKIPINIYFATKPVEGVGFYADLGSAFKSPSDQELVGISKNTAENVFNDIKRDRISNYSILNLGITYKLNESFLGFTALGYGSKFDYQGYKDNSHILGNNGNYYIEDGENVNLNFSSGIIFQPAPRTSSFNFYLSFNTFLKSALLGLGLGF